MRSSQILPLIVLAVSRLLSGSEAADAQPPTAISFDQTATEAMGSLTLGWNLGNSLDAPGDETAWGNPRVTPELLQTVAKSGFDTVRIPVTWAPHLGPGPDFIIDPKRLKRVEEIVRYSKAAGLTAIINLHHDGADGFKGVEWLTVNDSEGNTTEQNNESVEKQFVQVWKQIAHHFRDHDARLWFESMNEVHDGYGDPDPRHLQFINRLNQTFVEVVRGIGKNNARRFLVVPGYNTNIDATIDGFVLPKDPAEEKLILSVHFYDPYTFAIAAETQTWGRDAMETDNWGQEDHVLRQFDRLEEKFIDKAVPVFMGEYGATHQEGFIEHRQRYMSFVTRAASERGILPVYWDNGGLNSGKENFGLFRRDTGEVVHPKILNTMVKAAELRAREE